VNEAQFVNCIEEMVKCYRIVNSENSPFSKEIDIWRRRCIKENVPAEDSEKYGFILSCFLYMPNEHFISDTPENHLKQIENIYRLQEENK
jgi:hypothetical protein